MGKEIGAIRGSTAKEVLSRKFNIYMGISLNNKWFTKENIKEYILWGLKHTKKRFCVVIADSLQAINYQARSRYSKQAAIKKALKEGDKFLGIIKEILGELSEEERRLVDVIRWDELKKDPFYSKALQIFLQEFKTNNSFREEIKKIVGGFAGRLEQPSASNERIEKLSLYVIEELPELLNGFTFKETYYSCFLYPYDGPLMRLIEKIQKKSIFPEIHDKLEIKNNVFVVLKV